MAQREGREYRLAAIPGDGIGVEVIAVGLEILADCAQLDGGFRLSVEHFDWNSENYLRRGHYIPEGGLERLKAFDAIYFGAVGSLQVPDHVSLWGLRLPIAQGLDQFANVRPTRLLPGLRSPLAEGAQVDWVIIRENSEGEYAGHGGRTHRGLPIEVGTETAVFTRAGAERIHRFAFELARKRPRRHLTLVTKSNAQRFGMVLWDEVFHEVARDFPDVTTDRELVDAATARMVLRPGSLDVMVATNLHADILSDLAAALSGSLGIAPTANLNPPRQFPSMFEPIHGSAFDIAGKGIANPVASFWTASMMLDHLGEPAAARRLMEAIEATTASGVRTPDLGGTATTRDVTDAVRAELFKEVESHA
jgi:tartrate dehydrogenase/decarboxylase / D-malate dehydrogenase